jgi:carbonic anhydrase
METLVEGVARFQREVYPRYRPLFQQLANRQRPEVLFLTCADSRIDPNLITQTRPGQLFICRNIGNVVPPHGTADGGVATVMEFAATALGVTHIIVCGHSDCGAIKSLLDPSDDLIVPQVTAWLRYAEIARRVAASTLSHLRGKELLRAVTELNITSQLINLRTYPEVAAGLAVGKLTLHGWYYDIGTGAIDTYDDQTGRFVPLVPQAAEERVPGDGP